jgi:hypothetical protein
LLRRLLTKNCYSDPSLRPVVDKEAPHCSCTPETGCGNDCVNRQVGI